jgi:hypothetical protein
MLVRHYDDLRTYTVEEDRPRVIPLSQENLSVNTREGETGQMRITIKVLKHTDSANADSY